MAFMDFPLQDTITLLIIFINIVLTIVLVYIYMKNYRTISSKFTLGLLFFAAVFLIENIIDFYFYNSLLEQSLYGITSSQAVVNGIEMVGLILLLWITWK